MRRHAVGSWIAFGLFVVVIAGAIVVVLAGSGRKSYRLRTGAMLPTIHVGARLTADTDAYAHAAPEPGDIVVFHPPAGAETIDNAAACGAPRPDGRACAETGGRELRSESFVKRVVAVGPASVAISGGRAVVDGRTLREPYAQGCDDPSLCALPRPVTVPKGDVYVLGDDRADSDDSRFWGPVPEAWIVGRVERCGFLRLVCHPLR